MVRSANLNKKIISTLNSCMNICFDQILISALAQVIVRQLFSFPSMLAAVFSVSRERSSRSSFRSQTTPNVQSTACLATFSSLVVGGGLSSVMSFFKSSSRLDLAVCRWGDWEPRRLALSCGWPPSRPSLWCRLETTNNRRVTLTPMPPSSYTENQETQVMEMNPATNHGCDSVISSGLEFGVLMPNVHGCGLRSSCTVWGQQLPWSTNDANLLWVKREHMLSWEDNKGKQSFVQSFIRGI